MHDILARRHDNRTLYDSTIHLISPARQTHVQREIEKSAILPQVHDGAVCPLDVDLEIVEHHHPVEWIRFGGNQKAG